MSPGNRVIGQDELNDWSPERAGKELLFYATENELEAWVKQGLPKDGQPYQIIGFKTSEVTMNGFVQEPVFRKITEALILHREDGSAQDCFICSEALAPKLELPPGSPVGMLCNYNGLILIQCWTNFRETIGPTTIRFIEELTQDDTGEKLRHAGYARIFESICQEIDRHMAYTTCTVSQRGKIKAKHTEIKMSQTMAELCLSGEHKFVHQAHQTIAQS